MMGGFPQNNHSLAKDAKVPNRIAPYGWYLPVDGAEASERFGTAIIGRVGGTSGRGRNSEPSADHGRNRPASPALRQESQAIPRSIGDPLRKHLPRQSNGIGVPHWKTRICNRREGMAGRPKTPPCGNSAEVGESSGSGRRRERGSHSKIHFYSVPSNHSPVSSQEGHITTTSIVVVLMLRFSSSPC